MISGGVWELLVSSIEVGALCLDGTLWDERAELHTGGAEPAMNWKTKVPKAA